MSQDTLFHPLRDVVDSENTTNSITNRYRGPGLASPFVHPVPRTAEYYCLTQGCSMLKTSSSLTTYSLNSPADGFYDVTLHVATPAIPIERATRFRNNWLQSYFKRLALRINGQVKYEITSEEAALAYGGMWNKHAYVSEFSKEVIPAQVFRLPLPLGCNLGIENAMYPLYYHPHTDVIELDVEVDNDLSLMLEDEELKSSSTTLAASSLVTCLSAEYVYLTEAQRLKRSDAAWWPWITTNSTLGDSIPLMANHAMHTCLWQASDIVKSTIYIDNIRSREYPWLLTTLGNAWHRTCFVARPDDYQLKPGILCTSQSRLVVERSTITENASLRIALLGQRRLEFQGSILTPAGRSLDNATSPICEWREA